MSNTVENAAIVGSKAAAYSGAGWAIISGLTLNELGVIIGIVVGIAGLLLGQFWSWRRDAREGRESEARLYALRKRRPAPDDAQPVDSDLAKLEDAL